MMSKSKKKSGKNNSLAKNPEKTEKIDKYVSYKASETESPLRNLYEKDLIYYNIFVSDFIHMKHFYEKILEFEIAAEAPEEYGWCEFYLPVKGARIGLFRTDKKLENISAAPSLNIPVKDLEKASEILKEKAIDVSMIQDVPDMISMFDFRDPEGNRISFVGTPRIKT